MEACSEVVRGNMAAEYQAKITLQRNHWWIPRSSKWIFSPPVFPCEVIYLFTFVLAESMLQSWISGDILWLICRLICWVLEALLDSFGPLSVEFHTRSLPVPLTV